MSVSLLLHVSTSVGIQQHGVLVPQHVGLWFGIYHTYQFHLIVHTCVNCGSFCSHFRLICIINIIKFCKYKGFNYAFQITKLRAGQDMNKTKLTKNLKMNSSNCFLSNPIASRALIFPSMMSSNPRQSQSGATIGDFMLGQLISGFSPSQLWSWISRGCASQ